MKPLQNPFSEVVAAVMRHFGEAPGHSQVKILELGFGTGNNIEFLARESFTVAGLEGSEKAVEIANARMKEGGLDTDLNCQDFTSLKIFENGQLDFALDRGSITHNRRSDIENCLSEVQRVLKPGGLFFQLFSASATVACLMGNHWGTVPAKIFKWAFSLAINLCSSLRRKRIYVTCMANALRSYSKFTRSKKRL